MEQNEIEKSKTKEKERNERIENGIWHPGILDSYPGVGLSASTKMMAKSADKHLRTLGDVDAYYLAINGKSEAGIILGLLRDATNPDADLINIIKSKLSHSGNVKKIDEQYLVEIKDCNAEGRIIPDTDGLITDLSNIPLYVAAADCNPVGIYDPTNHAIGVFHNGTYGLLNRISENGLQAMTEKYGTNPLDVIVVIGPGASERLTAPRKIFDEYRVKYPQVDIDRFIKDTDDFEIVTFDLGNSIKASLMSLGIPEDQIELSNYHTDTNNDLFSSEITEGTEGRGSIGFMMCLRGVE